MAVRRLAPPEQQPKDFAFTAENAAWAKKIIARYPEGRQQSAIIPLLWRAQEQHGGWLPEAAIRHVAEMLGMAHIRALEVATFYTMFLLQPVGRKAHVQVCGTTPCMLRGSEKIFDVCRRRIHHEPLHVSADGDFSWEEVECLGACVNAPMVLIWNDTYEDLTAESFERVLDGFAKGAPVKPGPQIDRQLSAPVGGPTTLTDPSLYASAMNGAEALAAAEEQEIAAALAALPKEATPQQKADAVGRRPAALEAAREGKADDLQLIRGIGQVNEEKMHALGVFHFSQIAGWSREEIRWVGTYLSFPGRIDRENWVGQAKALAEGGVPEYVRVFGKEPR